MVNTNNNKNAGFTIHSDNYPFALTFSAKQVILLAEDMMSRLENEIREFLAEAEDAGAEDEANMSLGNYVGTYWQAYLNGDTPNPMPYLNEQIFTSPSYYFTMWGIMQSMLSDDKCGKISCSVALEVWEEITDKAMAILCNQMSK